MTSHRWNIDEITAAFAAAASGSDNWQNSLQSIEHQIGGAGATIVPLAGRLSALPVSRSFEEPLQRYFADGWVKQDLRFHAASGMLRNGIATDFDCITPDAMERHPYYKEWLEPYGLKWFAAIPIHTPHERWVLSLQRTHSQGPFSATELDQLKRLGSSFSASAALGNALSFARADAVQTAFDMSGKGLVLLDREGKVVCWNSSAEQSFTNSLYIKDKRIVTSDTSAMRLLDRAVRGLLDGKAGLQGSAPISIRRTGAPPLVLYVSRARGVAIDIFSHCQIFVVIVDLRVRRPAPVANLRSVYGLTNAEAELAFNLSTGMSLQEVAASHGISYQTERTRLKTVFDKMGVNSQSDLIASVLLLQFGAANP